MEPTVDLICGGPTSFIGRIGGSPRCFYLFECEVERLINTMGDVPLGHRVSQRRRDKREDFLISLTLGVPLLVPKRTWVSSCSTIKKANQVI